MKLRILLATLWIFSSLVGGAFLCGCSTLLTGEEAPVGPVAKVYPASYDEVWRALQKALIKYPIQINNIDTGVIETELVKAEQVWTPPVIGPYRKFPNLKYSLRATVQRGKYKNKDSMRVTMVKNIKIQKDFFSDEKSLNSDGYEEKTILYRIDRELHMEGMLKRAFSNDPKTREFEDL